MGPSQKKVCFGFQVEYRFEGNLVTNEKVVVNHFKIMKEMYRKHQPVRYFNMFTGEEKDYEGSIEYGHALFKKLLSTYPVEYKSENVFIDLSVSVYYIDSRRLFENDDELEDFSNLSVTDSN